MTSGLRVADFSDPNYWRLDALQAPVFSCDTPTMAIAGPGSGKTRTIIAKAARLIQANGNDGSTVALVTFTKAAALEMEARLRSAIPEVFQSPRTKPYIGTFHGLAFQLLRNAWRKIEIANAKTVSEGGIPANPRPQKKVLSDQEVNDLIGQSAKDAGCDLKFEEIRAAIERYKSFPADYQFSDDVIASDTYAVFGIYEKRRVSNNAMDVNDMVRECLAGIRAGTINALPVKYMLADEMQDADMVQIDFVLAHFGKGVIPTLVADDDQSIYAFRNAAGFRGLQMYCAATGATILPMTYNYRSCSSIVEAASLIIGSSPDRFPKDIRPMRSDEGSVSLVLHESKDAYVDEAGTYFPAITAEAVQANDVAEQAKKWLSRNPKHSCAVISRTNAELDTIELACKFKEIPTIRVGASDFMRRTHIERAIAALRLPARPLDHVAFASACQASSNLSKSGRENVLDFFHSSDGQTHVLDLASDSEMLGRMRRDDQTYFRTFRAWITDWFDAYAGTEAEMSKGIVTLLNNMASHCKESWVESDIRFLGVMLSQWCSGSLDYRLNILSQRQKQAENKNGAITLCSAHASKGLEFDHVTIINADCHKWPHDKSDGAYYEEQRIFYVAATRPKDHLTFSFVQNDPEKDNVTVFVHPILLAASSQSVGTALNDTAGLDAPAQQEPLNV